MPNPLNMQTVLRGELVKKFESVIRQEMAEHQKVISNYHEEIHSLRETINYSLNQCVILYRHSENELKNQTDILQGQINEILNKIKANSLTISDHEQTIFSLFQSINECLEFSVKKTDFEELKKQIETNLKEKIEEHDRQSQNQYRFIESCIVSLNEELKNLKNEFATETIELYEKIENKFTLSNMNKDTIIKEIRIFEKTIFIIEKKIENLYTLIERINKRGDACPKLV